MHIVDEIENFPGALKVSDLVKLLGFSKHAIYDFIEAGTIPCYRIGSGIRFDPRDTANWLRERANS